MLESASYAATTTETAIRQSGEQTNTLVPENQLFQLSDDGETGLASALSSVKRTIGQATSLSAVMRMAGALTLAAAMGLFLVDGVNVANDLQRYLTILGFTMMLTGLGFLMSHLLKEMRGARMFFALALLSVPVNFTVFGALLYSQFAWDRTTTDYPSIALWQLADTGGLIVTALGAMVLLIPTTWFSMSVLARGSRTVLSLGLLSASALLLLPVRGDGTVALIAVAMLAGIMILFQQLQQRDISVPTLEGRIARGLLFVPVVILVARGVLLYEASTVLTLALVLASQFGLRLLCNKREGGSTGTIFMQLVSAALALITAVLVMQLLSPDSFASAVAIFDITLILLLLELGSRTGKHHVRRTISILGSTMIALSCLPLLIFSTVGNLILACIFIGSMMSYAIHQGHRTESILAALLLVVLIALNANGLMTAALATGWWGVATAGVLAIVAASLVERYGAIIKLRIAGMKPTAGGDIVVEGHLDT